MDEDLSIALKDGLDENSKNPYGRAAVIDGYRDSCRIVVSHVLALIVERKRSKINRLDQRFKIFPKTIRS